MRIGQRCVPARFSFFKIYGEALRFLIKAGHPDPFPALLLFLLLHLLPDSFPFPFLFCHLLRQCPGLAAIFEKAFPYTENPYG